MFDQKAAFERGDFVAVWCLARGTGVIKPFVKRLAMGIAPWAEFPHVKQPGDSIVPMLILETLNPPRMFSVDMQAVYGVHKCLGVTVADRLEIQGETIRIVAPSAPKPKRKPRARKGGVS